MNKLKFERETLQPEYIDQDERDSYLRSVTSIERWINNEFKKAIEDEGLIFNLDLVNKLKSKQDAIRDVVNKHRKEYLDSLGFVPKSEIDRVHLKFNEVIDDLTKVCYTLWKYTQTYVFPLKTDKQGYIKFDPELVKSHIESIGVKIFTDSELSYMELLQDAIELLTKIRNIEIENDYNQFALNQLSSYITTGFKPSEVFALRSIRRIKPTNTNDYE
ncbi:hypothetical protein E2605_09475 [Dysgonomonas capnocytophagoides]|uniref:Uncharacterized protein n=1 Tax=Dysgonomonas capnocytophagoides TaxID=45254 RepID=A0A4Y8L288_9BACT|nr:hypothetical protein [Dysgonomonas capnocytophagoides]TFD96391.1 hypothetical protein E2605_09475 [Dysgonomonas capnocytophagoides]